MQDLFIIIGFVLFAVWNIVLTFLIINYRKKYTKILSGVEGKNLEEVLKIHMERVDKAVSDNIKIGNDFTAFCDFSKSFLHKVGFKRFNPFENTGGDQSFAVAILDDNNNGFVISSMHAREGTRVYAKPVKKGEYSGYKFSAEEEEVVKQAVES